MPNSTTFTQQICDAQIKAMAEDSGMIAMGLGIDDPKRIFNTTSQLAELYGKQRVFDMPTAENAMTGVGIGAAISGSRVLMTHQRVDFFLLAMDQLVNNAAKWHYMFNGQMSVPLTIRLIIGRGWGQGPTHQQSLQSWFAHIPGLKVICPGLTDNVGQLLYSAIMDNNPTVFLEHRWLHNQTASIERVLPIHGTTETTRVVKQGKHVSIIANSFMLLEALHAAEHLHGFGIECEVIEVAEPTNVNWALVYESIKKTQHCIVTEIGHLPMSFASEVATKVVENCFHSLKQPPIRIGLPNYPEPTSSGLTKNYYPTANTIIDKVNSLFGATVSLVEERALHDVPGQWFTGPF